MRILKFREIEVVILIYHQILVTNLQGNALKLEGRINNQILGVKRVNGLLMKNEWVNKLPSDIYIFFLLFYLCY